MEPEERKNLGASFCFSNNSQLLCRYDADTEFVQLLDWLSALSPVTFYEINEIKGTDAAKLAEASVDTLRADNVAKERTADAAYATLAAATQVGLYKLHPVDRAFCFNFFYTGSFFRSSLLIVSYMC